MFVLSYNRLAGINATAVVPDAIIAAAEHAYADVIVAGSRARGKFAK